MIHGNAWNEKQSGQGRRERKIDPLQGKINAVRAKKDRKDTFALIVDTS